MRTNFSRAVIVLATFIALSAYCDKAKQPVQAKKVVKKKTAQPKKQVAKPSAKPVAQPKKTSPKKKDGFDDRMAALEQRVDDILWRCDLMAYSPFSDHILFPHN